MNREHSLEEQAAKGPAIEVEALKADSFGRIALMRDARGLFVRRDLSASPWWLRLPAWRLARREALALRQLVGQGRTPQLLGWDGTHLDRSFLDGVAMYKNPPRGDLAYFRAARRLLQQGHRRGIAHNDLAKEANWLVRADGQPALIDFQLAVRGNPRSRWMRLLAREDLRHLLKHKRTYCPDALTARQRVILDTPAMHSRVWRATGKRVYKLIARRVFGYWDNEGQGRIRD